VSDVWNEYVKLDGQFNAAAEVSQIVKPRGRFNVSLVFGTGTVQLQRRFDGGAWRVVESFNASVERVGTFIEPEANVEYRFECTAFTAGPISYRLSQ
jgi:hypothetical protein